MAELGFDFGGVEDVDPHLSIVGGRLGLAQSLLRRLTTRKGTLLDDPSYGYDLRMLIGAAVTRSEVEQGVSAQVLADERVRDAQVQVTVGETIRVDIRIVDSQGPFRLVLAASDLSVEILEFIG
jgi:hypothetical protein